VVRFSFSAPDDAGSVSLHCCSSTYSRSTMFRSWKNELAISAMSRWRVLPDSKSCAKCVLTARAHTHSSQNAVTTSCRWCSAELPDCLFFAVLAVNVYQVFVYRIVHSVSPLTRMSGPPPIAATALPITCSKPLWCTDDYGLFRPLHASSLFALVALQKYVAHLSEEARWQRTIGNR
jgi:hypothetical protein